MFRVVEIHKFGGRRSMQRLIRMQSTQVTEEIFAGQFDLIVTNPKMLEGLDLDAEVILDVRPMVRDTAKPQQPPIP